MGYPPSALHGVNPPQLGLDGGTPSVKGNSRASTYYVTGGIPLALRTFLFPVFFPKNY